MPELFTRRLTQRELKRRIGRLEQVAGIRLVTLGDGSARGVRVLELRTGTGFSFDVLVDRCFDIGRCELSGRPLVSHRLAGEIPILSNSPRMLHPPRRRACLSAPAVQGGQG